MKQHLRLLITLCLISILNTRPVHSQVCASPSTTIYGLAYSGLIYPINVTNASVGAAINTAYGSPNQADAMGYNPVNGYFYYFNASTSPNQFISYNPLLHIYTLLAACPASVQVVASCVTPDGMGIYARDNSGTIYYYNISLNTWTTITSTYFNATGTNITATIQGVSTGGDMAFDAAGNLFLLFSSFGNYGLYQLSGAVPTSTVASVTLKQVLPSTTATPDGNIIAGIAFSYTGQFYLSTMSNHLYILNNNLTTTLLGTFSTFGVGVDLTSCNFPTSVLPVNFIQFNVLPTTNSTININWSVAQKGNTQFYLVQESQDASKWQDIGKLPSNNIQGVQNYYFNANTPGAGNYFYRIVEVDINGQQFYSETKMARNSNSSIIGFSPNPASSLLNVQNNNKTPLKLQIFDAIGRCVKESQIQPGTNNIDISLLPKSTYMILVQNEGKNTSMKFIKE